MWYTEFESITSAWKYRVVRVSSNSRREERQAVESGTLS